MNDYKKSIGNAALIQEYKKSIQDDPVKMKAFQAYAPYLSNFYVQGFLDSLANFESGHSLTVKNQGYTDKNGVVHEPSTAQGLFQFIDATAASTLMNTGMDARAVGKFGVIEQSLAALSLIDEQGAMKEVAGGDLAGASKKLGKIWDALPDGANQPRSADEWNTYYGASMEEVDIKTNYTAEEMDALIVNELTANGEEGDLESYKKYKVLSADIIPKFKSAIDDIRGFNKGEEYEAWRAAPDDIRGSVKKVERDIRLLRLKKNSEEGLTDEEKKELQNLEQNLTGRYQNRAKEYSEKLNNYTSQLNEYMEDEDIRDLMGEDFFTYDKAVKNIEKVSSGYNDIFQDFNSSLYQERARGGDEDGIEDTESYLSQPSKMFESEDLGFGDIASYMWANTSVFGGVGDKMYNAADIETAYKKAYENVSATLDNLETKTTSPLGDWGEKWQKFEADLETNLAQSVTKNNYTYHHGTGTAGSSGGWFNWIEKQDPNVYGAAPDLDKTDPEKEKIVKLEKAIELKSVVDDFNNPQLKNMSDEDFTQYINEVSNQKEQTGESALTSIFGEGTVDSALQFMGMAAAYKTATAPLPHQVKSPEWRDHMYELKQRANRGISAESQTMHLREMDRTYSYDVQNIARYSRSSQAVLASLGGAGERRANSALKMAAMNEDAKTKNYQAYGNGLAADEAMTQGMWERNVYNEADRKRELKAAVIGQMTKNVREDRAYARQYGEGSYYAKYMNSMAEEKKQSAISTRSAQLKDAGMQFADGKEYSLTGAQALTLAEQEYNEKYGGQERNPLGINQVLNQNQSNLSRLVGGNVAQQINSGTTFLQSGITSAANTVQRLKEKDAQKKKEHRSKRWIEKNTNAPKETEINVVEREATTSI